MNSLHFNFTGNHILHVLRKLPKNNYARLVLCRPQQANHGLCHVTHIFARSLCAIQVDDIYNECERDNEVNTTTMEDDWSDSLG